MRLVCRPGVSMKILKISSRRVSWGAQSQTHTTHTWTTYVSYATDQSGAMQAQSDQTSCRVSSTRDAGLEALDARLGEPPGPLTGEVA